MSQGHRWPSEKRDTLLKNLTKVWGHEKYDKGNFFFCQVFGFLSVFVHILPRISSYLIKTVKPNRLRPALEGFEQTLTHTGLHLPP